MKVLVTGATGFLGQHTCERLLQEGNTVTALGRNETIGAKLNAQGACFKAIALEDKAGLIYLCQDQDYVLHCAALSSPWGNRSDFYSANVLGTQHVIDACFQANIKKLVYVSSPSIYFDFTAKENIVETTRIPRQSANYYIESKKIAEQCIDKAFAHGLPVITLRPRALFGPGDNAILPRILKNIKHQQFPLINNGQALIDMTYIDNVVDSLLLAMEADPSCLGKKYNITNGEPMKLKTFITMLFQQMGLTVQCKSVSYRLAMLYATVLENLAKLPGQKMKEPALTRYGVGVLGLSQTLNIQAARTELGYRSRITIEQGISRLAQAWKLNHG